ncbi:sarcosine oxidase subunit gamma [Rhizobium calliandrae]|uniref:Sarcosine oxidase subunit gamma n=1 Tax=Rhizobium calliandrae TaxID=1312182 RepID=A0ABT7KDP7_9HYPH|nr:sarcosine oxidase subunit gamma [Rhizobium calliandrae]MDL2405488.1 sarcosine oxidase subunit gamma [Rhizobium calliandrae]
MADLATRKLPLAGRHGGAATVRLTAAAPASRISLRAPAESIPGLSWALKLDIPQRPKTSSHKDGRYALWLGPDEWLIIDESGVDLLGLPGDAGVLYAATDISHRNTAIIVSGPGAETSLAGGCPQDLSLQAFPVGACSRTLFGKAEVVLLRIDEETFRVEVWRSFSDYAFGLLAEAAEDAGL